MALILGIETSSERCSVALGDGVHIEERSQVQPREHHALVLTMVAELLHEAGIALAAVDAIAFGSGPGSFTGLRIAASIAQGLAFGADRPVVPVSSLDALAFGVRAGLAPGHAYAQLLVATDAHMGEIYWARYALPDGAVQGTPGDQLAKVADFSLPLAADAARTLAAGAAWQVYPQLCVAGMHVDVGARPAAKDVVALALRSGRESWLPAERAEPVYVRGVSAWKKSSP